MKSNYIKIAAAAVMAAGMAFAQTAAPAPSEKAPMSGYQNRRARAHRQMMEELNLNASQKTQARTIFHNAWQNSKPVFEQLKENHQALAAAVKSNDKGQIEQLSAKQGTLRGKLVANHELAMAQFYQILTPEQRTKADQMQRQMQTRMQQRFERMQQEHQGAAGE